MFFYLFPKVFFINKTIKITSLPWIEVVLKKKINPLAQRQEGFIFFGATWNTFLKGNECPMEYPRREKLG